MRKRSASPALATAVLSWVAGFADTAGFLQLNGLFTAHITGNLIVAGAELVEAPLGAHSMGDTWVRIAVMIPFLMAVVLTTILADVVRVSSGQLLWLEAAVLVVFAVLGVLLIDTTATPPSPMTMLIVGSAGVFALGVQNALMRASLKLATQTTVMTGNVTQFGIDLTRLLLHAHPTTEAGVAQQRAWRQTMRLGGGTVASFVLGAASGALLTQLVGFWGLFLPVVVMIALAQAGTKLYLHQAVPPVHD